MNKEDKLYIEFTEKANQFYLSFEWRRLRYTILRNYAAKCMLCNRTDLPLHVDHIKPLRKYWVLRLEYSNLQVLCEECNHGKGNWDETDWRPQTKTKQKLQKKIYLEQLAFDRKREAEREIVLDKIKKADEQMTPKFKAEKQAAWLAKKLEREKLHKK
jgi:HNH endonuclease